MANLNNTNNQLQNIANNNGAGVSTYAPKGNNNSTNGNNSNLNTGTILDIIREKTANIEQITHQQSYKNSLISSLRSIVKRERNVREATISVRQEDNLKHEDIINIIENKWLEKHKEQLSITYWQDKEFSYCQFIDKKSKESFLKEALDPVWPGTNKEAKLRENIKGLFNNNEPHFTRKPVKMEIPQVRPNIKMDKLKETLDKLTTDGTTITGFKEGKPHNMTKNRSVYFLTNAKGVRQLLGTLDGAIPYANKDTGTRTKLIVKINAKPWQCRECLTFGHHQCQGRICNQCGMKGHETRECKTKTKNCNNCRKRGHKAKDNFCPTYTAEIIKEIRKMDIPIEYIEDKNLRNQLINSLQTR